jgi:hypothetical protein
MSTSQLVQGRECGGCTLCCIVPAIDKPELQKLPSSVCRHCSGGGCAIYESRPQTCRTYYCGWRWSTIFPDDWRPDQSGVFAQLEDDVAPQFQSRVGIILLLVGNPLKTLRQQRFIDFVVEGVNRNIALSLGLPGPEGMQAARLSLNTKEVQDASRISRAETRLVLEKILKRLTSHQFIPYPMEHSATALAT